MGSHCALQVLKGAKEEGFNTVLVTKSSREKFYRRYDFIDEYIVVEDFQEIVHEDITNKLTETDSILIPHGTLISEVGIEKSKNLMSQSLETDISYDGKQIEILRLN